MTPRDRLMTLATVACVLGFTGCRTAQSDTTELDLLLRAVSYDTSVPPASPSAPSTAQYTTADSEASLAEKAASFRQGVANGLKTTAGVLLYGVFKIAEAAFGFVDDDDYSPRGRADRNFNQWLDDRDRWRRDG